MVLFLLLMPHWKKISLDSCILVQFFQPLVTLEDCNYSYKCRHACSIIPYMCFDTIIPDHIRDHMVLHMGYVKR